MGHFVSSPREREQRDSKGDEREGHGRNRNRISVGRPGDVRYTTSSPNPTYPFLPVKGRKEIEEIVEEMKERNRKERGTGMKVKKQKK